MLTSPKTPRLSPYNAAADSRSNRPDVVFAHANGYPSQSYRKLLDPLAQQFTIYTIEHRPLWSVARAPRRLSWRAYADDLIQALEDHGGRPVWLVGHSMGAVVSVLVARQRPDLVVGLAALDPVLVPRNTWLALQFFTRVLRRDMPIVEVALRRPHHFESLEAAFAFYRSKRPFRRVSDDVLWDYVNAGHEPAPSHGVKLRWSGAWEACVYRSAPSIFGLLDALQLPMLGIAGKDSDVLDADRLCEWQRVAPQLELEVYEGGHLIPLEAPDRCAARISEFISAHQSPEHA